MTIRNPGITKTEVIPVGPSQIFDQSDAKFAVGMLAIADQPLLGRELDYASYFDLRRKVYVDETSQLSLDDLAEDGTDRDVDDARSVAFGAFENLGSGMVRTVGAMRLIMKGFGVDSEAQRPLPIEEFCPDIFGDAPAPAKTTEVSRLIAHHENARTQEAIRKKVYAAGLAYVMNHDLGPTYAVVEPWFFSSLEGNVPARAIGVPRYIEHYLDENLPIQVLTGELADQIEVEHPGRLEHMRKVEGAMTYSGKLVTAAVAITA